MTIDKNNKIQGDNAVIMAAGTSSRFAPLSFEKPKSLYEVKGEILIERQIRQLKQAGINDVTVVVGYRKEQFSYLPDKFGVDLVENPDYLKRNNNGSVWAVRERLGNTYICSSDNYFTENPFEREVSEPYYAACYAEGETGEWCIREGPDGYIDSVTIGGRDSWYMMGHVFWDREFSRRFVRILESIYDLPETAPLLWEAVYMNNLDSLKLKMRRYMPGIIEEFDTLDDLRKFDSSYKDDARSPIIGSISARLGCPQSMISDIVPVKDGSNEASGFVFSAGQRRFMYSYSTGSLTPVDNE